MALDTMCDICGDEGCEVTALGEESLGVLFVCDSCLEYAAEMSRPNKYVLQEDQYESVVKEE